MLLAKFKLINTYMFATYAKHAKVTQSAIDYYEVSTTK
jgi:hypothetical protein